MDEKCETLSIYSTVSVYVVLSSVYIFCFQFQSYIQLTRLEILKAPTVKRVKIIERSIQNNRFCFLELAKRNESLCKEELAVLHSW